MNTLKKSSFKVTYFDNNQVAIKVKTNDNEIEKKVNYRCNFTKILEKHFKFKNPKIIPNNSIGSILKNFHKENKILYFTHD